VRAYLEQIMRELSNFELRRAGGEYGVWPIFTPPPEEDPAKNIMAMAMARSRARRPGPVRRPQSATDRRQSRSPRRSLIRGLPAVTGAHGSD
jgi:hypothetical protein